MQNKHINNAFAKYIPGNGLTSEILKDITRFNPIDIGTNVIGAISNTPCIKVPTNAPNYNDSSSSGSGDKSKYYLQYATDYFPEKKELK